MSQNSIPGFQKPAAVSAVTGARTAWETTKADTHGSAIQARSGEGADGPRKAPARDELNISDELNDDLKAGDAAKKDEAKKADQAEEDQKAREEAEKAKEEKLKEVEQKIEETTKKLEEAVKNGDTKEAQRLLGEMQDLYRQKDAIVNGAEAPAAAQPAPAAAGAGAPAAAGQPAAAPAGAPGGFAPAAPGGGFAPGGFGGNAAPAGYIDGPIMPFNGKTVKPLDKYTVTSEFGPRWGRQHTGIDLAAPTGTPIKSVADGTVTRVANDPKGYGNWVEVKHADGSTTRYAHMSSFGNIKVGSEVGAGSVLGAVGSTGNSTGPHLHFEWRDPSGNPVNPRRRMDF